MKERSKALLSHSLILNHPVERSEESDSDYACRLIRLALISSSGSSPRLPSDNHNSEGELSIGNWKTAASHMRQRTRLVPFTYFLIVNNSCEKKET